MARFSGKFSWISRLLHRLWKILFLIIKRHCLFIISKDSHRSRLVPETKQKTKMSTSISSKTKGKIGGYKNYRPSRKIILSNGNTIDLAQQKLILTSAHVAGEEDVEKLCSVLKENDRVTHLDLSGIFLHFLNFQDFEGLVYLASNNYRKTWKGTLR